MREHGLASIGQEGQNVILSVDTLERIVVPPWYLFLSHPTLYVAR